MKPLRYFLTFLASFLATLSPLVAYNYQLSIATIFRDEAPYLKEWIEYHKLVGVEHFYLYNHLSQDNYKEVLSSYIKSGEVELIEWKHEVVNWEQWDKEQIAAYNHALKRAKSQTKWLAFIDSDEFLVPIKDKNLPKLLSRFSSSKGANGKGIGGICGGWVFFGTSHVDQIPKDKLLIEVLLLNSGPAAGGDASAIWNQGAYKSIVRPKRVKAVVSPHYCTYHKGYEHTMVSFSKFQINHYWTRDEHYLNNNKIPRRLSWGQDAASTQNWANGMNSNHPAGKAILRFIADLKKRMGQSAQK